MTTLVIGILRLDTGNMRSFTPWTTLRSQIRRWNN